MGNLKHPLVKGTVGSRPKVSACRCMLVAAKTLALGILNLKGFDRKGQSVRLLPLSLHSFPALRHARPNQATDERNKMCRIKMVPLFENQCNMVCRPKTCFYCFRNHSQYTKAGTLAAEGSRYHMQRWLGSIDFTLVERFNGNTHNPQALPCMALLLWKGGLQKRFCTKTNRCQKLSRNSKKMAACSCANVF